MDIPRRNRIDLMTPAELAIREAMLKVEEAGCDVLLTDAVNLLHEAQERVADFVDKVPRKEKNYEQEAIDFLKRAAVENCRIVSSNDLHHEVIVDAQVNHRFWVDPETALGWALIPWDLSTIKDRKREADYFMRNDMLR